MGGFLTREKPIQAQFKAASHYYSAPARAEGEYKGKFYDFCLPIQNSDQNLFPEIRESAPAFFAKHNIQWHDGNKGKPSNHLCDSMVCCVNFLFPFADKPNELAQVFRAVFSDLEKMLPVEDDQYVSFEWIGENNYLGEKIRQKSQRTRGANFTSADSVVMFERKDKKKQIVLIEWKYTESYASFSKKYSVNGTDRTTIYRHLLGDPDCPLDKDLLPSFDALFFEPFYQLMRQQFLAHEMEKAHELGADIVSLLHIAPAHNKDFRKVTSPDLEKLGNTATGVWKKLVKPEGRFISVSSEKLFGYITTQQLPEMKAWIEYIQARYPWVGEK